MENKGKPFSVWRTVFPKGLLALAVLTVTQCGIIGDPDTVVYDLNGTVTKSKDSTAIDSLVVYRKIFSGKIGRRGIPSDTVVVLNGNYQIALIARIEPEEAISAFHAANIYFRIERLGFLPIDTSFSGKDLPIEKYRRSSFEVKLPNLYMIPDTSKDSLW